METIRKDGDQALAEHEVHMLRGATEDLEKLKWRLLFAQPWFWEASFERLEADSARFGDDPQAQAALRDGRQAVDAQDLDDLRKQSGYCGV